jgi:hypothetical protein
MRRARLLLKVEPCFVLPNLPFPDIEMVFQTANRRARSISYSPMTFSQFSILVLHWMQ